MKNIDDVSFDLYRGEVLGVSGLMGAERTAARLNSAQPTIGTGNELDAIAAVVLGY